MERREYHCSRQIRRPNTGRTYKDRPGVLGVLSEKQNGITGSGAGMPENSIMFSGFEPYGWKRLLQDCVSSENMVKGDVNITENFRRTGEIAGKLQVQSLLAEKTSCTYQDFLSGKLNIDEFKAFLGNRMPAGISNFSNLSEDGEVIDKEAVKYSIYTYGAEFGTVMCYRKRVLFLIRQGNVQSLSHMRKTSQ